MAASFLRWEKVYIYVYVGGVDMESREKAYDEQYTKRYHKLVFVHCTHNHLCLVVKLCAGEMLC